MEEHKHNEEVKEHRHAEGFKEKILKHQDHKMHQGEKVFTLPILALIVSFAVLTIFNQLQINAVSEQSGVLLFSGSGHTTLLGGGGDLSDVDVAAIQSTPQAVAAVFDLEGKDGDAVMATMFPTGTPSYGEELGVSYDDPVNSLATLAKMYRPLKAEVEKGNPEAFQRYISLASKPKGVSCEYCCGIGPVGADESGNSRCGCQHNPALLTVALYLSAYSDMSDAQIIHETMKWKTLFFPKNMIEIGGQIAGGDQSVLQQLPGMVGGC